jgi:hypothetical protein
VVSPIRELPELDVIKVVKLWSEGYDPFEFSRPKHKRIPRLGRPEKKGKTRRQP